MANQELTIDNFAETFYNHWNRGEMDDAYGMLAENIVDHNAGDDEAGLAGVKQALDTVRRAFPDHKYTVNRVIVDRDKNMFAVHLTASGTHTGDFFGIAPSGKHASWNEVRIIQLNENMKCTEHWAVIDGLAMMLGLGHVNKPGKRTTF